MAYRGRCLLACLGWSLAHVPLLPAQELEQVLVTGRKPTAADGQDLHGFTSHTSMDRLLGSPASLAEVVARQPGVAFNGQGGQFQTVSIRGLSRQRVGSFFLDIPLLAERRAGTAASFVDPTMLDSVELVRGPATTAYGSGNIGGLVRSRPLALTGMLASVGWGGSGDQNSQFLGFGTENSSIAVSRRGSGNAETPDGTPLHTEYDQYNLMVTAHGATGQASYDLVSLVSYGDDIGKSNARFPDRRVTSYPRERHWLSQLSRLSDAQSTTAYFHYQDLETEVVRPGEQRDVAASAALDFGARHVVGWGPGRPLRWGLEYQGRRNVRAEQWRQLPGEPAGQREQILRAKQDEIAGFIEGRRQWRALTGTAGLRLTVQRQDARGWSAGSDRFVSGYLGASLALDPRWRLTGELARGVRGANLSEKYFSGTTGRGTVIGNPALRPEIADSLDIGVIRATPVSRVELHVFHMWLDEFIERVPLGDERLGFGNQPGGNIRGLDFAARWSLATALEVNLGGHWQEGENGAGEPLQDVSPNQLSLGLSHRAGAWQWTLDYRHRYPKTRVAAGEQPVGSANILDAALRRALSDDLVLGIWARNLLNEEYLLTTDELSTAAEKMAFGIELSWRSPSH